MKKYVFISNSNKPTKDEYYSREEVRLTNVNRPCIETALDMGYSVYLGVNRANPHELECEKDIQLFDSHTYRNIFDFKSNFIAFRNTMKVLRSGDVEVIHCNTPIGGVVGRICGKIAKVPKIIYTAHGFHFYKGAPLINRTLFKWVEKILAIFTDVIITMNQEDYEAAKQFKLRNNGKVYFVHGVGVNTKEFQNVTVDRDKMRNDMGFSTDDVLIITMGDLIPRKNYKTSILALSKATNNKLHYLICGKGPELNRLKEMVRELDLEKQVHFLGFRKDIKELLKISDIFLFTSYQEGLPRSMMEAMASGLPVVASRIRGNIDLIEDGKGGFLFSPDDVDGFANAINRLADDSNLRNAMGRINQERIKEYDVENVKKEIEYIYRTELADYSNNGI